MLPSTHSGTTVHFSHTARLLASEARRHGLVAPGFRCPPRVVGALRSIRRTPTGAVVAVQVKDRPWPAVVADMIEGVVLANRLVTPEADRVRTDLWHAVSVDWPAEIAEVA